MDSVDFEWVVMAIRIQREVGGNLAELLLNGGRDHPRAGVPRAPGPAPCPPRAGSRCGSWADCRRFMLYLLVANPTYLDPLITTPIGWVMLAGDGGPADRRRGSG